MPNGSDNYDAELQGFGYKPELNRILKTVNLASFGLTYLQPIGPAVIFGFLLTASKGSVSVPYLIAFIGMLFTVFSYSVLIKQYPLSGSIYNYVKLISGPFYGFIAGWLLMLDYILIPTIASVSASIFAHQLISFVSYEVWLFIFVITMGILNIVGIKPTASISGFLLFIQIIIVLMSLVILASFIINKSNHISALFSLKPFHFKTLTGVFEASSLAIFSFLGFDAVTTLAEESVNPRKDIPKAMYTCLCVGFLIMFVTGYLGVLAIPEWQTLTKDTSWVEATLFNLVKLSGGELFSIIYTVGFVLAMVVTNLVGTTAGSRLLFGMGRDAKISRKIFATVGNRWKTPHRNIVIIMLIELVLGTCMNPNQIAEIINYGAISGFIILNASLIEFGYQLLMNQHNAKLNHSYEYGKLIFILRFFIFPTFGFVIMLLILLNMNLISLLIGTLWLIAGIIYYHISVSMSLSRLISFFKFNT